MRKRDVFDIILIATLLYIAVANIAYAIAHPEQTQTQNFLNLWNVLTWQW